MSARDRVLVSYDARGELVDYRLQPSVDRLWRAIMLSPNVEICEALLRGETVPIERLDPEWVERLGRRK